MGKSVDVYCMVIKPSEAVDWFNGDVGVYYQMELNGKQVQLIDCGIYKIGQTVNIMTQKGRVIGEAIITGKCEIVQKKKTYVAK